MNASQGRAEISIASLLRAWGLHIQTTIRGSSSGTETSSFWWLFPPYIHIYLCAFVMAAGRATGRVYLVFPPFLL